TYVWMNSFGFGSPLPEDEKKITETFTKITDLNGKTGDSAFCPTSSDFMDFYCDFVKNLVHAGAKAIVLDDDLCLNIRPGLGCVCDEHLRRIGEILGKPVTREELRDKVFAGEANEYRAAWCKVMGDTLKDFCRSVRKAVDSVDPSVRVGFCSGYTSWDEECADPVDLTRILAGNTKPFLRYTAAPYWEYTYRFPWQPEAHIVEFARQQFHWCKDVDDVDLFTEIDSYPRPCGNVPAFALESFDFMTGAAAAPDRLKYLFDYISSPQYERGYFNAHMRNRDLIGEVSELLGPLPAAGIYVHETKNKFEQMTFPAEFTDKKQIMRTVSYSSASALLSANAIPMTYENNGGVTAAFGDSGRTVSLSQKAYIIDIAAAEELMKRGVDVGILSYEPAARNSVEYFYKEDDFIRIEDGASQGFVKATLAPSAQVQSEFFKDMPASYVYENDQGMKFLVFLFRGDFIGSTYEISSSYYRREQIIDFCNAVGQPLPVSCKRTPKLHIICKETDTHLGVAFCNYGNDLFDAPLFETACTYTEAQTFGCNGQLEEKGFRITEIPPRTFGAFLLKKKS
ncbi:MAG: hypothetical protein II348_00935, partial [Clostridia bacterium]|nr:hypothetical protein [Clostridia bacterium]